jgi:hypothetical protein
MSKELIVKPKLIRRNLKSIYIFCGGKNCNIKQLLHYSWSDSGKDQWECSCGVINQFMIPEI